MLPPGKSPPSSPRLPRGLVWLSSAGLLCLVLGGIINHQPTATTPSTVPPAEQLPSPARPPAQTAAAPEKSPREKLWERKLAAIAAASDPDERDRLLTALANEVPLTDLSESLAELQNISQGNGPLAELLLRRWAVGNGAAAATWVQCLPPGPMRRDDLQIVAIEWSNQNAQGAAAWARTLTDPIEAQTVGLAVANETVRADPLAALRLAVTLPPDNARAELIRRAATEWAAKDAPMAVAWAANIPDDTLRATVLASEAVSWAEQDPIAAGDLVVQQLPPGRLQEDAVISIVQRWAQQQPEAAAAWVEQFPAGTLRDTAFAAIASLQDSPGSLNALIPDV